MVAAGAAASCSKSDGTDERVDLRKRAADKRQAELRAEVARATAAAREELPDFLARLAKRPSFKDAAEVGEDGDLRWFVYSRDEFERAELSVVKADPFNAWGWNLTGGMGIAPADFGAPGAVRDLIGADESVTRMPVGGMLHVIEAGPLAGAVLVRSMPPMGPRGYQVATVAFHQQTGSLLMRGLCDVGLVPDVAADRELPFKDACTAAVAKRLRKPVAELFPSPWMVSPGASPTCELSLSGDLGGRSYLCTQAAGPDTLVVDLGRARR